MFPKGNFCPTVLYCIIAAALAAGNDPAIKPETTASGAPGGTKPPEAAVTKSLIPALSTANMVNVFVRSFNVAACPDLTINLLNKLSFGLAAIVAATPSPVG